METHITIPHTDLKASRIALGTVNAGLEYDGTDADRLFDLYLDLGGNVIDSARVYFDWVLPEKGRSERVIGDWFRREKKRDQVILITKGGHPDKDTMHVSRMGQQDMEHDINLSLKSLGVDYIDIYFYHRDDPTQAVGELLERMEGFRKAGKIRYYGCSNWTTARMIEADAYAQEHGLRTFVANQMLFNYGSKYMKPFSDDTMVTMDSAMMEYHTKNTDNIAMPYFGLCSGFFHLLAAGQEEKVKNSPYYTPKNLELAERLKSLCRKYTVSISQILMAFYMMQDFTAIPLAGAINGEELKDTMETLRFNFEAGDFVL
ncbi:MAG: aldo/keto reductase [Treponema sp.]|nr:aldo/keto reductase [Treponema sp.]